MNMTSVLKAILFNETNGTNTTSPSSYVDDQKSFGAIFCDVFVGLCLLGGLLQIISIFRKHGCCTAAQNNSDSGIAVDAGPLSMQTLSENINESRPGFGTF